MPRYYDVLKEHNVTRTGNGDPDVVSVSPYAIIAVWRYQSPVTFSRAKQESFSKIPTDATTLRGPVLLIVEDILTLQVGTTKTNPISQLNATLLPGANYLTEAFPGDWIGAWMVNSSAAATSIIERLLDGKPCNKFNDGLKFLGRISAVRKRISQDPNGIRTANYLLNAAGFQEFDASIYYEPYLASSTPGPATGWLQYTGETLNRLIAGGFSNKGGLTVNDTIPVLFNAFYGQGAPKSKAILDPTLSTSEGLDNPNAMIVPSPVAGMLGVTKGTKSSGAVGWHDICNLLMGVQKYQLSYGTSDNNSAEAPIFTPDNVTAVPGERLLVCNKDLLGTFLASPPQFDGQKTVWSILKQYSNESINEMFTCLRTGPDGTVMPTLVVRQLPFTTDILNEIYTPHKEDFSAAKKETRTGLGRFGKHPVVEVTLPNEAADPRRINLTRFRELPRWRIDPILIHSVDFGRSDSLRINFLHVYAEAGQGTPAVRAGYIIRDPPVKDELDILRSGLRPYMMTVNCSPKDALSRKAGDFMYILGDIMFGQHLTLTGTISTVGIQAPICIGDNTEFDGHLFHMEGISHMFQFQPSTGKKTFTTNISVSHGLKSDQLTGGDFDMFSGTANSDLRGQEPGMTREYLVNASEPSTPPIAGQKSKWDHPPLQDSTDYNQKVSGDKLLGNKFGDDV